MGCWLRAARLDINRAHVLWEASFISCSLQHGGKYVGGRSDAASVTGRVALPFLTSKLILTSMPFLFLATLTLGNLSYKMERKGTTRLPSTCGNPSGKTLAKEGSFAASYP